MKHPFYGALLFAACSAPAVVLASDPASHDVTLPTGDGEVLVVEWTGAALAGASGVTSECLVAGVEDSHDINLTVPDGAYDSVTVTADFHIEWEEGEPVPGELFTDPDLVLTVMQDGVALGSSDGGSPEENVGLVNPEAGTLTAVVCPFFASAETPYSAKLTLTVQGAASCLMPESKALAHSTVSSGSSGAAAETSGLLNFDRFSVEAESQHFALPKASYEGRYQSSLFDQDLGVPTFLWAQRNAAPVPVGALASERDILIARARDQLRVEAKKLKLTQAMIDEAEVVNAQYNGAGPAIVRFRQRVNGYEVYYRYINVLLDRSGKPVAVSGYFATDYDAVSTSFGISAKQAILKAWEGLGGSVSSILSLVQSTVKGEYETYLPTLALGSSHVFEREPRVRRVYYPRVGGLTPAYYVELFNLARSNGELSAYALVVSAVDGSVLHRKNLVADAADFNYRVFADSASPFQPYDSPVGNEYTPFPALDRSETIVRTSAATQMVSLSAGPISTGDPWLADDATTTVGNNVEACIDSFDTPVSGLISNPLNTCDPELGDMYGETNGANTFDYDVQADTDPSTDEAMSAAVVNLFFINNWLHDWWYDHGFDEASGNAQTDNYERGGVGGDPIRAQGQDASGRNNANMATPADGSSPTMQQYLFDGKLVGEVRQLTPVEGEALDFTGASFGPTVFDVTGVAVLADDGVGESSTDGCGLTDPVTGLVTAPGIPQPGLFGNIAVIDRGGCNFTTKAQFALLSGASAMIVVNNTDGAPITMGNGDIPINAGASPTDAIYQIPSVMIRKADGDAIKLQMESESVTMHVQRDESTDVDGTLDNQIIAHEFFHYVHHRLTDSSSQQTGGMSEGWGDIDAFMLSTRPDDVDSIGNDVFQGAYSLAGYVIFDFYSGIRRAPYSTDMEKNAFTFKHISDGEPTPDGGDGSSNSEVHNAGEIWANMMWECYVGLLNDTGLSFDEAQQRMKDYIIGGLKMTPANATYTEARDAVLSVVLANDFDDYAACSAGFAKRGAGLNAVSPARSSEDLVGVIEDYSAFVCETEDDDDSDDDDDNGSGGGGSSRSGGGGSPAPALLLVLAMAACLRRLRLSGTRH